MLQFVFTQITKANTLSCNKFNSSMIFKFKNIIWGWPDKIQDIAFKSTKASDILNDKVKIVPLDNTWGKKRIFERIMFCFEKGYVISISSCLRGLS